MNSLTKSFGYAISGLKTVWKEERNFRLEVWGFLFVVVIAYVLDFSFIEKIICLIFITLVLSAEIMNTVIEDLCNKIEPNQDPVIGKVKDLSSAFVLVVGIGAALAGLFVVLHHFFLI